MRSFRARWAAVALLVGLIGGVPRTDDAVVAMSFSSNLSLEMMSRRTVSQNWVVVVSGNCPLPNRIYEDCDSRHPAFRRIATSSAARIILTPVKVLDVLRPSEASEV